LPNVHHAQAHEVDGHTATTPLSVAKGGSGAATLTDHGILLGSGTGAITPLGVLTTGQKLVGVTGADPVAQDDIETINFVIDGGGSVITTGQKGHIVVDFACTIVAWTILADASGSIVVDVWADSYANFPPTVADTITGSEKPTLSSAQKNQDTSLTTWTTAIAAGTILAFNVDSATTVKRITVALKVQRT